MNYTEILIEWYQLTLKTIALRLSEQINQNITADDVHRAIADLNNFTDNTQVLFEVADKSINSFYFDLVDYNFLKPIPKT